MALVAAVLLWRNRQTRFALLAGIALAVVLLGFLAIQGLSVFDRFTTIWTTIANVLGSGQADASTNERLDMFDAAKLAFAQRPWIGWGWANLGNAAAEVNPAVFASAAGTLFMFHGDIANLAVAGGVVGLGCLAAMLIAPVVGALASPRDRYFSVRLYCCAALSLGYAASGLTDSVLGFDAPTTLYAFLTAIVLGAFREQATPSDGDRAARP
jgi:O-antigen ligase